jgi:SCY1-like protein 1
VNCSGRPLSAGAHHRRRQIHGNVCLAAVVVSDTLDWRLHSFDLMSEWTAERPPEALMAHAYMVADQYKPEEVRKGAWDMLRDAPPW